MLAGGLAGVAALAIALIIYADGLRQPASSAAATAIGGPFELVDQDGRTVTEATYRGKWLLIYFGYTYCPDACPTALNEMAESLDGLDDVQGPRPAPVHHDRSDARYADGAQALHRRVPIEHHRPDRLAGTDRPGRQGLPCLLPTRQDHRCRLFDGAQLGDLSDGSRRPLRHQLHAGDRPRDDPRKAPPIDVVST
ncbi:MAG: SCO family protein [Pseudomonadota bacterium]